MAVSHVTHVVLFLMLVLYAIACSKQSRDQTAKDRAKDNRNHNNNQQQNVAKQSDTTSQDTNKCDDVDLHELIQSTLFDHKMSALAASQQLQRAAADQFGAKFQVGDGCVTGSNEVCVQAVVSTCDFAYRHWFGVHTCKTKVDDKYVMVWKH